MKKKKLVFGWGINDANYTVRPRAKGKQVWCPYYACWSNMIRRCYDPKYQKTQPTYIGCSVAEEWRSFMAFRSWMMTQDWQGKALDKDIINPGNKVYSPSTCVFVSSHLNNLLMDCGAARGEHPVGVYWDEQRRKYQAHCRINGKKKHLGSYSTPDLAHQAYILCKALIIAETAEGLPPLIKRGLLLHRDHLLMTLFS